MYTTEFIDIPLRDLLTRVQTLKHKGIRFVQMCAETTEAGIDLLYTFYDETCDNAINLCVYGIDETSEVPSIQGLYFAAFSYENETHDLYGVHFVNMELDFGGNFFNVATDAPMTVITPEQKAERDKLAKQKAAAAAKARKAAEAKQAAEADAAAGEKAEAAAAGKSAGSVADKADTMAGCFGLNLCPSGTADPNGLRRCAIGIIRILRKFGFALDVRELFARAQMGYGEREWKVNPTQCLDKLDEFFKTRLRSFYQGLGVNTLLVDAALGANCRTVKGVDERVEALKAFSQAEGYASSVQTFKRVANIVAKHVAEERDIPATWKKSLLKEDAEKSLAKVLEEALPILNHLWEAHDYSGILAQLEKLRPHLDNFFDHVMVACDDAELCANRLAMLKSLSDRFSRVADFAALQI